MYISSFAAGLHSCCW